MQKNITGTVYLVGAGPGDPELISVKGKLLLQNCDAVIFDNLIPDELVVSLPQQIEKYYAGKISGRHYLPQDEINKLIVRLAQDGKNVVRLKGGDPFTFGRGAEEAQMLRENNIEFEIVPGITAGIAVPAYGGIPCTDRHKASFVTFATGHKAIHKDSSTVPWDKIAKYDCGTLIIYMGVGEFENIVNTLIEHGMPPDTPAAVIERGTYPSQRIITSPVSKLTAKIRKENIKPPAIFVIGEVAEFHKNLHWFNRNIPLFGIRIMVTRPADQASEMYKSLRDLGAEVMPYPTIATKNNIDSPAWEFFKESLNSSNDNWLLFTSENAVRYFIRQLKVQVDDIRCLARFKIAAVGYGTAKALKEFNLKADFVPQKATTASFAQELKNAFKLESIRIFRIRGNLADDIIERTLTETGANVAAMTVYQTFYPEWPEGFKEKLFNYPPDVIIFTSGSSAEGLCKILTKEEIKRLTNKALTISIGPSTSRIIEANGIDVSLEAKEHNIPGIIKELVKYYSKNKTN